jgi:hypothetical protein
MMNRRVSTVRVRSILSVLTLVATTVAVAAALPRATYADALPDLRVTIAPVDDRQILPDDRATIHSGPVGAGDPIGYYVRVLNNGPVTAPTVTLALTLTGDATLVSWDATTPTNCEVPAFPTWTCRPGASDALGGDDAMVAGQRFAFLVSVAPKNPGTIAFEAEASSASGDANPDDNVENEMTTVFATTTLTSSATPSDLGRPVTFTATVGIGSVAGGTRTGTVQFRDGGADLGSSQLLSGNQSSLTSSNLGVGDHAITAVYSGDADLFTNASAPLTQSVLADAKPPTCIITGQTATSIDIQIQDIGSGLVSIAHTDKKNASVVVDPFERQTRAPVNVHATRIKPSKPASFMLSDEDFAGNRGICTKSAKVPF